MLQCAHGEGYLLYFLLALLYQIHIIEQSSVYIVRLGATGDNYFPISCLGRLPFAQGWRFVEMTVTDGNRTKFNVSEYHHVNCYGANVGNISETITQTPVSGSCCLPLGALQSMWAT